MDVRVISRRFDAPDEVLEAKLHAEGRYDRLTHDVEAILGRPATSARDFVARHAASFAPEPFREQRPCRSGSS